MRRVPFTTLYRPGGWLLTALLLLAAPAWAQPVPASRPAQPTSQPTSQSASQPAQPAARRDIIGPGQINWKPHWPRFSTGEWITTGAFAAMAISAQLVPSRASPWQRGILADEAARDVLRLDDLEDRRAARDMSDVLLTSLMAYPYLVDALVMTAWHHRSPDAALEMALINAEVLAITAGLQGLANIIGNRERPYGRNCGGELPADLRDCDGNKRYKSFYSGHSAQAFASAGLICSHHLNLELYGGGWADIIPCAAGFVAATATATLRVVGDQHYLSDVAIGAAMGTIVGLGVPWLLHYRHGPKKRKRDRDALTIRLVPMPTGAGLVGTF